MIEWPSITSVFFDLDNTLIDHTGAEERAFDHCYHECGLNTGRYDLQQLLAYYRDINNELWAAYRRGEVTTDVVRHERFRRIVELQFDTPPLHIHPDRVSEVYLHAYDTASVPLEGAAEAIALTKRHSGFVGIITNGFPRQVTRKLEHQRWTATFDVVTISSLVGVAKPHPDVFKAALATRDHQPGEAVYIGDNYEADVIGASKAGWKTVFIRNAHERPEHTGDADMVIDSLCDLHACLALLQPRKPAHS